MTMKSDKSLRQTLEQFLFAETKEDQSSNLEEMLTAFSAGSILLEMAQLHLETVENCRKKQALAEERQILLNQWQREIEASREKESVSDREIKKQKKEIDRLKQLLNGYENQFVKFQQEMKEQSDLVEKNALLTKSLSEANEDRKQAWAQFKDRDQKLNEVSAQLSEANEDR